MSCTISYVKTVTCTCLFKLPNIQSKVLPQLYNNLHLCANPSTSGTVLFLCSGQLYVCGEVKCIKCKFEANIIILKRKDS